LSLLPKPAGWPGTSNDSSYLNSLKVCRSFTINPLQSDVCLFFSVISKHFLIAGWATHSKIVKSADRNPNFRWLKTHFWYSYNIYIYNIQTLFSILDPMLKSPRIKQHPLDTGHHWVLTQWKKSRDSTCKGSLKIRIFDRRFRSFKTNEYTKTMRKKGSPIFVEAHMIYIISHHQSLLYINIR
jgi:hypothetical protein